MIKVYTNYFKENNMPYEIVCTDRYNTKESSYDHGIVYYYKFINMESPKLQKLIWYFKYRKYVLALINKNKYGYLVVWGEHTAVLFSDYLKRKKIPYCVNVRDVAFPKIPLYQMRLKDAVKYSDFATWCAQKGTELLPPYNYLIVLNQNKELVKGLQARQGFVKNDDKIRIGAVGYIRHIQASKELMRVLKNDSRYVVQFFGTGSLRLKKFAEEIGMENIEIEDTFSQENTSLYVERIDVINSYCGDGKDDITISLGSPIRYGYSTYLYKPAIVSPHTFLSERTKELNIAFTIDNLENFPNDFYKWYHALQFETFKEGCDIYNKEFDTSLESLKARCNETIKPIILGE